MSGVLVLSLFLCLWCQSIVLFYFYWLTGLYPTSRVIPTLTREKSGKLRTNHITLELAKPLLVPGESTGRLTFVSAHVYVQSQYTNVSTHLHLVSCDSHTDLHFAKLSCFKLWVQYFIHSMDGSGHVDVRLSCVFCVYLESSLTGRGIVVAWWSCGGCVNMHVFVDHVISGPCRPAITWPYLACGYIWYSAATWLSILSSSYTDLN